LKRSNFVPPDNPHANESQIIGIPASDVWDTLSSELKEIVVSEVADHIIQIFRLRFGTGGSLYTGTDKKAFVGPIVAIPFYRALDGVVRLPEPVNRAFELHRAPFDKPSNYLRSVLDAELRIIEDHYQHILEHEFDGDENRLKLGIRVLEKAVKLSSVYPGDICISEPLTSPGQPFSLRLDDFRLSNIMVSYQSLSLFY
jgi:hypothetical protein